MYLHLGQDTVVRFDDIIGIFDIESASVSGITKEFLARAQQAGAVVNVSAELPKAFILCAERDEEGNALVKVYISQISSTTLLKRAVIGRDHLKDNAV